MGNDWGGGPCRVRGILGTERLVVMVTAHLKRDDSSINENHKSQKSTEFTTQKFLKIHEIPGKLPYFLKYSPVIELNQGQLAHPNWKVSVF